LREEVKDLRRRIEKLEQDIQRIEDERFVTDTVTGGYGGTQHFTIRGFPHPEYSRKKTLFYSRKASLEALEYELLETINLAEEFINSLDDARMRRLLQYRYIDDLTWIQVAHKMGGKHTEDSCKKAVERFFKEI
jgi:hypothetical protein